MNSETLEQHDWLQGFGCMSLTPGFYGEDMDITETEKTLRKALDLGVTLLDTADFYTSMTSGELYQNIKLIGACLPMNQSCMSYLQQMLLWDQINCDTSLQNQGAAKRCVGPWSNCRLFTQETSHWVCSVFVLDHLWMPSSYICSLLLASSPA